MVTTPELTPPPVDVVTVEISYDDISRRAYEVWVRKGYPDNHPDENWREAEAELRAEAMARVSE